MAALTQSERNRMAMTYASGNYYLGADGQYHTMSPPVSQNYGFVNYEGSSTTASVNFENAIQPSGSNVNSRISTVQIKAGFVGQVYVTDPTTAAKVILWESSPKKTLAKADKAAKKAQLRAAQRSFE